MRVKRSVFITVTAVLGVAVLALAGVAVWLNSENQRHITMLENTYESSFYDLVQGVDDIDVKLKKINFSTSKEYQNELLTDVWRLSDLAQAKLGSLSHSDTVVLKTTRFLNQLGDYSKYLAEETENRPLTEEEKTAIKALYKNCQALGKELSAVMGRMEGGYSFVTDGEGSESLWSQTFSELEDTSIDYPSLIYDGPFSDSVQNRVPKGLGGENITPEQGLIKVKNILKGHYDVDTVKYVGRYDGDVAALTYEGDGVTVQLSENGRLLVMNASQPVGELIIDTDEATRVAAEFVENAGFCDMTAVWVSTYYDNAYINFVCEKDGVIIYPDMVKVKVSLASGKVAGVEAVPNFYCCTARDIPSPKLSEDDVRGLIRDGLEVESVRLAIIPRGSGETLTYEIFGTFEGEKYFLYLDADTGREVNVLCVIDGEQGLLL